MQRVAGFGEINPRRHQHRGGGKGKPFVPGTQDDGRCEVPARRGAADDDGLGLVVPEERVVDGEAVVESRRKRVVRRHAVIDGPDVYAVANRGPGRHGATRVAGTMDERAAVDVEIDAIVDSTEVEWLDVVHPHAIDVTLVDLHGRVRHPRRDQ